MVLSKSYNTIAGPRRPTIQPWNRIEVDGRGLHANLDGRVKHAARQMPNGLWRSKMGKSVDIEHELAAVEGPLYGTVVAFVHRRRPVHVE